MTQEQIPSKKGPPRHSGAPTVCALIHALKRGGSRKDLAAATGQSERAVGNWVRHFRAEGLVRVTDLAARGAEVYHWIERGDPTEDTHKIHMTLPQREAAWRKRKTRARVSATPCVCS